MKEIAINKTFIRELNVSATTTNVRKKKCATMSRQRPNTELKDTIVVMNFDYRFRRFECSFFFLFLLLLLLLLLYPPPSSLLLLLILVLLPFLCVLCTISHFVKRSNASMLSLPLSPAQEQEAEGEKRTFCSYAGFFCW